MLLGLAALTGAKRSLLGVRPAALPADSNLDRGVLRALLLGVKKPGMDDMQLA